jgi:hypothetical protein
MSTATLEKPVTTKKSGVEIARIPSADSMVARFPEVPDTPSSDANMTPAMAEALLLQQKTEALASAKTAMDTAVASTSRVLGGTKLEAYTAVGHFAYNALVARKACVDIDATIRKTKSPWKATDTDGFCADFSLNVRIMYPGLVKPLKESSQIAAKKAGKRSDNQVRVIDWIEASLTVKAITPILKSVGVESLGEVSYAMVFEYISPYLKFSKTDLSYALDARWIEFIRTTLPRLINEEIEPGEFIAEIEAHSAKLADDANHAKTSTKTPAQIAQAEAEKNAAKAKADAKKLRTKCNEGLATSLDDAMKGLLSDDEIRVIVSKIEKDNGRSVVSKAVRADLASFTVDEFKAVIKALAAADKFDVIKEIVQAAKRFEALLADETPAVVPMAKAV